MVLGVDSRFIALAAAFALAGCGGQHRTGHSQLDSVPWRLVKAQGQQLRITSAGGGCQSFDHTAVRESKHTVQVAVYNKAFIPGPGEGCTAEGVLYRLTITLRKPLDRRTVLHAPTSPASG